MHAGRQSNRYILSTHRAFIAQMLSLFLTQHTVMLHFHGFIIASKTSADLLSVIYWAVSSLWHSLSSPQAIYVSWLQTDLFYFSSCLIFLLSSYHSSLGWVLILQNHPLSSWFFFSHFLEDGDVSTTALRDLFAGDFVCLQEKLNCFPFFQLPQSAHTNKWQHVANIPGCKGKSQLQPCTV